MDKTIDIRGLDLAILFGPADSHLRIIEDSFHVKTVIRNDIIKISGDKNKIDLAKEIIHEMKQTLGRKGSLNLKDVKHLIEIIEKEKEMNLSRSGWISNKLILIDINFHKINLLV